MRAIVLLLLVSACFGVKHVHLLDSVGQNMLFRGGSPEVKGSFSVTSLVASLSAVAALPAQYELVVINVENLDTRGSGLFATEDGTNVVSEMSFFLRNASVGRFLFWHMVGTRSHAASPVFNASGVRAALAADYETWGSDKLVERVEMLGQMVQQSQKVPQVIFFHCDCGCDRTGQLAGGYMMRFQNKSWSEVVATNTKVAGRPQVCDTHFQMQWYCLYLNTTGIGKSTGDCLESLPCTKI